MQILSNVFGAVKALLPKSLKQGSELGVNLKSLPDVLSLGSIKQAQEKMITTITEKMCNDVVTSESLNALMAQFDKKDHSYVIEILKQCQLGLQPTELLKRMEELTPEIRKKCDFSDLTSRYFIILNPSETPASGLAYHFRKMSREPVNCVDLSFYKDSNNRRDWGGSTCLMDTIFSKNLTADEINELGKIQRLTIANISNMEAGVNYVDWVTGKVPSKIRTLVEKARNHQADNSVSMPTAVTNVLEEILQKNLELLNVERLRNGFKPAEVISLQSPPLEQPTGSLLASTLKNPTVNEAKIKAFFDQNDDSPEKNALLLKLLSSEKGIDYHTIGKTVQSLKAIDKRLTEALKQDNVSPDNVFVITDLLLGKSSPFITYLFRQSCQALEGQQFIKRETYNLLQKEGKLPGNHAVLLLDDINGTGGTIGRYTGELNVGNFFKNTPQIYCGHLSGYETGEKRIKKDLIDEGINNVKFLKPSFSKTTITSDNHSFKAELTEKERALLGSFEDGYQGDMASDSYYWSRPDNLPKDIGAFFEYTTDMQRRKN